MMGIKKGQHESGFQGVRSVGDRTHTSQVTSVIGTIHIFSMLH